MGGIHKHLRDKKETQRHRETQRETERHRDRERVKETERERDRERETEGDSETQREQEILGFPVWGTPRQCNSKGVISLLGSSSSNAMHQ